MLIMDTYLNIIRVKLKEIQTQEYLFAIIIIIIIIISN